MLKNKCKNKNANKAYILRKVSSSSASDPISDQTRSTTIKNWEHANWKSILEY